MPTSVDLPPFGDLVGWVPTTGNGDFCCHPAPRLAPRFGRLGLRALQVALTEDHPDWTVARLATAADVPVGQAQDGVARARNEWTRGTVGTGTSQRRLIDDRNKALDWALAIERSRPTPRVTTTPVAEPRDHAALLQQFAQLADRARVRYAVTSVAGAQLLLNQEVRATSHTPDPRFRAKPSRSRPTSPPGKSTIKPRVSSRQFSSCGRTSATSVPAIRVTFAAYPSPPRFRVSFSVEGNNDRYAEVAQAPARLRPRPARSLH